MIICANLKKSKDFLAFIIFYPKFHIKYYKQQQKFTKDNYVITPLIINSSPKYIAQICPLVIALCFFLNSTLYLFSSL
jgi:hypothetical protein